MRPFGVFLRVVEEHCFVGVDFILQKIVIDGFLVGKVDVMQQQGMTKLRIQTIEFDKYHPCLSPHIVATITNGFLKIVMEVILKLVEHVLRISHKDSQNVLGAIHSYVAMLICRLFQDVAKNFNAQSIVENTNDAHVCMLSHHVVPTLHQFEQRYVGHENISSLEIELALQHFGDERDGFTGFLGDCGPQVKQLRRERLRNLAEERVYLWQREKLVCYETRLQALDAFQPFAPIILFIH